MKEESPVIHAGECQETPSLRNIRFKACFTEFSVIHKVAPISLLVRPLVRERVMFGLS